MSGRPRLEVARRGPVRTVKVVVTGPYAAGTTTFVRTISEVAVLSTEEPGAAVAAAPETPAVAMDFGRVTVAPDLALYLFGTSGRDRFDVSWELVADGMLGVVFVVDGSVADDEAARRTARAIADVATIPHVIVVNARGRTDDVTALVVGVRDRLEVQGSVPVVVADVRDRDDVKRVLVDLLHEARRHLAATGPLAVAAAALEVGP